MSNQNHLQSFTFLVSGGHLTTALPFINLATQNKHQVIYVGRKIASIEAKTYSYEEPEVTRFGAQFVTITQAKLDRYHIVSSIILILPRFILSLTQSLLLIHKYKVNCVIGFGGYLSLPLGLAAKITNKQLIIHEQTVVLGLANQLLSPIANQTFLSYSSSLEFLSNKQSAKVIGNLVRQEITNPNPPKPKWLKSNNIHKPILFIVGGSQGSHFINLQVFKLLPILGKKYHIIHQTGSSQRYNDFRTAIALNAKYNKEFNLNYQPHKWINVQDYSWLLKHAYCVVSRAGANTIWELIIHKLPSIIIPLPNTHQDEQLKNALYLKQLGFGRIIKQSNCNPESILTELHHIETNYDQSKQGVANPVQLPIKDSAQTFYQEAINLINVNSG